MLVLAVVGISRTQKPYHQGGSRCACQISPKYRISVRFYNTFLSGLFPPGRLPGPAPAAGTAPASCLTVLQGSFPWTASKIRVFFHRDRMPLSGVRIAHERCILADSGGAGWMPISWGLSGFFNARATNTLPWSTTWSAPVSSGSARARHGRPSTRSSGTGSAPSRRTASAGPAAI